MARQPRQFMRQGAADLPTRASVDAYVGANGEPIWDGDELRMHDNVTPGGVRQMSLKSKLLAPFTGAIPVLITTLLFSTVHAAAFGVQANVAESQTEKLRKAIAWAESWGAELTAPYGVITLGAPDNDTEGVLRITKQIKLNWSRGTRLMPDATVGTRHILLVKPAVNDGVNARGIEIKGVQIGQLGVARNGGDGIRIDTTNKNGFVADLLVEQCCVADGGLGDYGFQHINESTVDNSTTPPTQLTGNVTGGMFHATIRNNTFFGGIKCIQTGDSNNIIENIVTGSNEGVYYDAISGAATGRIEGNNITATGDSVYIKGQQVYVIRNQIEAVGTYTGSRSNPALVTADGIATAGIVIENNNMNCYARCDAVAAINGARVRVAPNSVIYATDHFLYRAVNAPGGWVERQLSETVGGQSYLGRSLVSVDAASLTMGVWTQLTLLNDWAAATDANYAQGIYIMLLPDGTIRFRGTIVGGTRTPGTPIATLPVGWRALIKSQRFQAYCITTEWKLAIFNIILNGNITIQSLPSDATTASVVQFDGVSINVRPIG